MDDPIGLLFQQVIVKAGVEAIFAGLKALRERQGRIRLSTTYEGAEDFWYRGIEADELRDGSSVCLVGVLSPLAPFMPSHPRAKPGYSAAGWETVSQRLRSFLTEHRYAAPDDPLDAAGYDSMDLVVWGDAVIRPDRMVDQKVYAGLYNIYGKSFECVPVFLDSADTRQSGILQELNWPRLGGAVVELTGTVRLMPSYYARVGLAQPIEEPGLKCYCIEVHRIKRLSTRKTVLYATAWCGSSTGGAVVTEFFDYMIPEEQRLGLARLHDRFRATGQAPWFYYDFVDCPFQRCPAGNEQVRGRFTSP